MRVLLAVLLIGSAGCGGKNPAGSVTAPAPAENAPSKVGAVVESPEQTFPVASKRKKDDPKLSRKVYPKKGESFSRHDGVPTTAVAPFDTEQAKSHQAAWANHLGIPVESANSIGMKFALIPPGVFRMGSDAFGDDEKPVHQVTLTKPFGLGVYEVTQGQYAKIVGTNPSRFKGSDNPVEGVSWNDAVAFCKLLSDLPVEKAAGYEYRLPTEAEWEYACRAGTSTDYWFGNDSARLGEFAFFTKNSGKKTHAVGQKKPNPWGLYDMYGNLWELCHDWYGEYRSGPGTDPKGPSSGRVRVLRGGSWSIFSYRCRSAFRGRIPSRAHDGFRVVRSSVPSPSRP